MNSYWYRFSLHVKTTVKIQPARVDWDFKNTWSKCYELKKNFTFTQFSETAWCPVVVPWNSKLEINLDFRRTKHFKIYLPLEEMELGPNSSMTSFSSISNSHHSGEESSASLKREIEDAFETNFNPQVELHPSLSPAN